MGVPGRRMPALSEAIASRDKATIPFAAEPSIIVHSATQASGDATKITKIVLNIGSGEFSEQLFALPLSCCDPGLIGKRCAGLERSGRACGTLLPRPASRIPP